MYTDIVELFNTIQGEGSTTGRLVTLIRFRECPLSNLCWFCDTQKIMKTNPVLPVQIGDIEKLSFKTKTLMFTGGEPTRKPYSTQIFDITKRLQNSIDTIIVETNGLYLPDFLDNFMLSKVLLKKGTFVSISPKPLNNGLLKFYTQKLLPYLSEDKEYYDRQWIRFDFKFVLADPKNINNEKEREFHDNNITLIETLLKYPQFKGYIWLMPMGKTLKEVDNNYRYVIDKALQYNVNISFRLHIFSINIDNYSRERSSDFDEIE